MEIGNLPENVLFVELSSCEPKISKELKELNETVSQRGDCDVIVDLSQAEIINSSNVSNLLILRSFQEDNGRQLILYNVRTITKCIFVVAGLAESFVFFDEKADVLKALQSVG